MVEMVRATPALLDEIEVWLTVEDHVYRRATAEAAERRDIDIDIPGRGFLCNWNIVRRSFVRDPSNVHVLVVDGAPLGFVDRMDILEVHPAYRGYGYGKILAEFMLGRAFELGHSVAEIEIAPSSAVPFWERMGFTVDFDRRGYGSGYYAFRRFERYHELGPGARVAYRITFYEKERNWDPGVEPFAAFEGLGERRANGSVLLPQRAYCFNPLQDTSTDCVVRVEIAGEHVFEDKVKRTSARDFGLQHDPGGVYCFDELLLS